MVISNLLPYSLAVASGVPDNLAPTVTVMDSDSTPLMYNDRTGADAMSSVAIAVSQR